MEFQILNSEGVAMSINSIDKEVAEFFDVPVNSKYYATPFYLPKEELSKLSFKDRFELQSIAQTFN